MADHDEPSKLEKRLIEEADCDSERCIPADLLREAADAIGDCRRTLEVIEEWWLGGEMQRQFGAPVWMFLARTALAKLKEPIP